MARRTVRLSARLGAVGDRCGIEPHGANLPDPGAAYAPVSACAFAACAFV